MYVRGKEYCRPTINQCSSLVTWRFCHTVSRFGDSSVAFHNVADRAPFNIGRARCLLARGLGSGNLGFILTLLLHVAKSVYHLYTWHQSTVAISYRCIYIYMYVYMCLGIYTLRPLDHLRALEAQALRPT